MSSFNYDDFEEDQQLDPEEQALDYFMPQEKKQRRKEQRKSGKGHETFYDYRGDYT